MKKGKHITYVPLRCAPDVDWPKAGEPLQAGMLVTVALEPANSEWLVWAFRSETDRTPHGTAVVDVDEGDPALILVSNRGGDDTTILAVVEGISFGRS